MDTEEFDFKVIGTTKELFEAWSDAKVKLGSHVFPEGRNPHFGNDYITSGTWVMGVKLGEDEYQAVRRGDITGFSIGGYGRRIKREKNDLPEITYLTLQSEPLTDNPLVEGVDSPLNQPLD